MRKKIFAVLLSLIAVSTFFSGCGSSQSNTQGEQREESQEAEENSTASEQENPQDIPASDDTTTPEEEADMIMNVQVGDAIFTATLEENEAVTALVEMMKNAPVVIQMSDYSGFEKVGALGTSLPTNNSQTTTSTGDIVLYNGNQIVIFYGSNSWSYTRLGKIDDLTGWEEALGSGDVEVTFSLD